MLILLFLWVAQPVLGPVTDCPVVVEIVDPGWVLTPGVEVTVRDERTRTTQVAATDAGGAVRFTVRSCADDRCRFTISAALTGFKTVTLRRLWFGKHEGKERHVQIRLADLNGPTVTIRS